MSGRLPLSLALGLWLAAGLAVGLGASPTRAAPGIDARLLPRLQRLVERAESEPEAALEGLERLSRQWQRDPQQQRFVIRERAALLFRLERPEQARRELEAALQGAAESEALDLRYQLGQIALALEDPDTATTQLGIWAEQSERPRPPGLILLGYAWVQKERYDRAVGPLERALAAEARGNTASGAWIELLAYGYVQTGRAPEAIALFERLVAAYPAQARRWRQLASAYLMIERPGRGAAALSIAERVGDLSPEDTRRLARLLASLGTPEAAASLLERAQSGEAGEPEVEDELELAQLWLHARELERAIEVLWRAAERSGESEPILRIAQLYLQWERPAEAQAALQRRVAQPDDPARAEAAYLLALAHANQDNFEAAQGALGRVPDDPEYRERIEQLQGYLADRLRRRAQRASVDAAAREAQRAPRSGALGN